MKITQGEIYLVDFGRRYNSEFGKTRPAIVIQSNEINTLMDELEYKSVVVVPLSTQRLEDAFFRVDIPASGALEYDSQAVCNWVCTLDLGRLNLEQGALAKVTVAQLEAIREKLHYLVR